MTPEAGRLLYALVRATRPTTIVEFGMSFGISAIHLAAALRDNGIGRLVTTELSAGKIAPATKTFTETGLDDVITILEGDALTTLDGVAGSVDFVLLDGWKDLYLPVIKQLEPRLPTGALTVADNTNSPDRTGQDGPAALAQAYPPSRPCCSPDLRSSAPLPRHDNPEQGQQRRSGRPGRTRVRARRAEPIVVHRYYVHSDVGRLGVFGRDYRRPFPEDRRLVGG